MPRNVAPHATASPESLWTATDVMGLLDCSRSYVQEHRAELGAVKLGSLLRFEREAVMAFIARGRQPAAEPVQPEPTPLHRPAPAVKHRHAINRVTGLAWKDAR